MFHLRALEAPVALPNLLHGPNPKPILADKNNLRLTQEKVVEKSPDHSSSLRVTFAKLVPNNSLGSSTSVTISPHGAKFGITPTGFRPKSKNESNKPPQPYINLDTEAKHKFGKSAPPTVTDNRPLSRGTGELAELYRMLNADPKPTKHVDEVAKAKNINKKTKKKSKSTIALGTASVKVLFNTKPEKVSSKTSENSAATIATKPRTGPAKSRKMLKLLTSKHVSGQSKRSKSTRLKKKSKKAVEDEDLFKPAPLNEEYVSELGKIRNILKAVTAFDEGTSTEIHGLAPTSGESGRIKVTTHYHYSGDRSKSNTAPPGTSSSIPRPLSADELKQLLSSITRVVSLHQLPINDPSNTTDELLLPSHNVHSVSFGAGELQNGNNDMKKEEDTQEAGVDDGSSSETSRKKKKKKSRKSKKSPSKSLLRATVATISKINTKSKSALEVKRAPQPKRKATAKSKTTKRLSNSSVSSTERDPVQNAAFLKKYYEESVRLANTKSLEEITASPEANVGKKKESRKSLVKRTISKPLQRK